jgi:signal transduction histidine kinase
LEVRDDGCGFDSLEPGAPGKRQGVGNMRSRAEAMGGMLTIQSEPGKGTSVRLGVRFPTSERAGPS